MLVPIVRRLVVAGLLAAAALVAPAAADPLQPPAPYSSAPFLEAQGAPPIVLAQRWTCRSARSCREAVERWCGGYRRADGDGDGIPCENVCRSRAQVDEIRRAIGC
ncbi:calcium-binding protein [Salinarimonas chemoclinalis]|uniref:calcium-binding protein n=1 Tax=Salinarimonas chemoclinalis TaxID=3241599 RepID=UPI003558B79F